MPLTSHMIYRDENITVIKGFFDEKLLDSIFKESDLTAYPIERNFQGAKNKFATRGYSNLLPDSKSFFHYTSSGEFITQLEKLMDIPGLIPDPHLEGGGIHKIHTDGFLKMHTDFNFHKRLNLHRRVNMLTYLNRDWKPEWGGQLVIKYPHMSSKLTIEPTFNTTVIFKTTDYSWHGHPTLLLCPLNVSRTSLAQYYYTAGRPTEEIKSTSTNTNYNYDE